MTAENIELLGIPISEPDDTICLKVESALDYISAHTTLKIDKADINTITALPACAKLFIVKFTEIMSVGGGVASESLGGMSQSFDTTDKSTLLYSLLQSLLGEYMVSQLKAIPRVGRYKYGC